LANELTVSGGKAIAVTVGRVCRGTIHDDQVSSALSGGEPLTVHRRREVDAKA
jgi:hypothetical protein